MVNRMFLSSSTVSSLSAYLRRAAFVFFRSFSFTGYEFTDELGKPNGKKVHTPEKINYKNIFFTTTDKTNTFIQLSQIRESNNLRNMYYKYIANGYKNDMKLYDMVKTEELANSMYMVYYIISYF